MRLFSFAFTIYVYIDIIYLFDALMRAAIRLNTPSHCRRHHFRLMIRHIDIFRHFLFSCDYFLRCSSDIRYAALFILLSLSLLSPLMMMRASLY